MTEIAERPGVDQADRESARLTSQPPKRGIRRLLRSTEVVVLVLVLAVIAAVLIAVGASSSPSHVAQPFKTVTLVSPSYTPKAAVGTTDDYHCTLINPHVTKDSYVISSQFKPGSAEDHHAILGLVPPSMAATALQANAASGGNGWTCFGAPALPGASLAALFTTPWLSVWAPGHGADAVPKGSGISLPAGSLVIMQVHYNLLVGDKPVRNQLVLDTVPTSAAVVPLHLDLTVAPPDLPCPSGVTGPLCDRAASLADQGQRFGAGQVLTVDFIEHFCGHDPSNPPSGDTTSCLWPVDHSGYIVRAQAHMHLLGRSFSMILDPGTAQARTVLNVPNYNFDYQKAYNLATPIPVKAGDTIQITCSYDPTLAQKLPILRKAPAHYVTWGDGSSDEMCLGLAWTSKTLPNTHSPV